MKDDNNILDFDFDSYDSPKTDASSTDLSKNESDFVDIMSSSSAVRPHVIKSASHSTVRRKPHGFWAKLFYWWKYLKKRYKALIISGVSVILIFSMLLVWFFSEFSYHYKSITTDPESLGFSEVIDKKIVNVALFGIDTRGLNSFKGNSDSIMILSLNTETKKVKVISIMRDSFVPIETESGTVYNKINYAYSKGGPELAIKTLNQNFGLDISEYATVNFYGMADIIDAVGGIEVTLTEAEAASAISEPHSINSNINEMCYLLDIDPKQHYVTTSGTQLLNGIQAVSYARIRYLKNIWGTSNDFGRTDRQRYVMEQLFNRATQMGKSQYIKLAKSLIPCTETSLSYSDIISLAFDILLHSPSFEQARIPQSEFQMTSPKTSAGSVVYYDLAYASKVIHAMIYENMTMEQYIEANGIEKNDWYGNRYSGSSGSSGGTSQSGTSSTAPSVPDSSDVSSENPVSSDTPTSSQEPSSKPEEPNESEDPSESSGSDSSGTPSEPDSSETPSEPDSSDTPSTPSVPSTPTDTEPSPEEGTEPL